MSEAKVLKFYTFRYTTDCEGRNVKETKFGFFDKAQAKKFLTAKEGYCKLDGYGRQGGEHDLKENEVIIYDTCEQAICQMSDDTARQKALAKLTDKEKALLGLK